MPNGRPVLDFQHEKTKLEAENAILRLALEAAPEITLRQTRTALGSAYFDWYHGVRTEALGKKVWCQDSSEEMTWTLEK